MEHLCNLIHSLPDAGDIFAGDLARFRDRMCLREAGRCRVGIPTLELAMGGE